MFQRLEEGMWWKLNGILGKAMGELMFWDFVYDKDLVVKLFCEVLSFSLLAFLFRGQMNRLGDFGVGGNYGYRSTEI